jgi:SAM-dependent methyltransferase
MFHRLASAWIRHGPRQFVRLALRNIGSLPSSVIQRLRRRPTEFDRNLGIETDELCWIGALDLDPRSESTRDAKWYAPSDISVFERALASVPMDPRVFTFVDYGSGKGRVLILAARLPFQRVIGVEFSASLHRIAEQNISQATKRIPLACQEVHSSCCDATAFNLPDGPLLCYFYNPFGPLIMQRVMDRLAHSLTVAPRPIFIVYVHPVHHEVIANNSCFQLVEKNYDFCTFRSTIP